MIQSCIYAPTVAIEIEGKRLASTAVVSTTVDENLQEPGSFEIALSDELNMKTQKFTWLDNPDVYPANSVKINFGYTHGGKTSLFVGLIKSLSPSFPATGTPTLTVVGYDSLHSMNKYQRKVEAGETDVTIADLVKKLAELYHLKSDGVEDTEQTKKVHGKIGRREGQSDYSFLRELADDIGFEFFVQGDILYFRQPNEKQIIKTFTFRKDFINFSPRLTTASLVNEIIATGYNEKKEPIKEHIKLTDIGKGKAMNLIEKMVKASEGSSQKTIEHKVFDTRDDAKMVAEVAMKQLVQGYTQGSLECIGDPQLRPGNAVEIKGMGDLFSGNYYITGARHTLSDNGYTTSLQVRRSIV